MDKLKTEIIFYKKLIANTEKALSRHTKASDVSTMLLAQSERLTLELQALERQLKTTKAKK